MADKRYFPKFSHEYDDGPSGPARSYWDIKHGTAECHTNVATIALHHRDASNPEHEAYTVCGALNRAFEDGRKAKAVELRRALEI